MIELLITSCCMTANIATDWETHPVWCGFCLFCSYIPHMQILWNSNNGRCSWALDYFWAVYSPGRTLCISMTTTFWLLQASSHVWIGCWFWCLKQNSRPRKTNEKNENSFASVSERLKAGRKCPVCWMGGWNRANLALNAPLCKITLDSIAFFLFKIIGWCYLLS